MRDRPLLAVSLGDPNGIGPEVILKAAPSDLGADLLVVGSAAVLRA